MITLPRRIVDVLQNFQDFKNETEAAVTVLEEKYMQPAINLTGIQHLLAQRNGS